MKEWLKGYLSFSRKESTGVIALLSLIILVWLLPVYFGKPERINPELLVRADSLQLAMRGDSLEKGMQADINYKTFPFDPNLISDTAWKTLGVRTRTIETIRKYLDRGGRFRQAADLLKIYGLRKEEAERLMPMVRIADRGGYKFNSRTPYAAHWVRTNHSNEGSYRAPAQYDKSSFYGQSRPASGTYSRAPRVPIDINSADSALFESLPGIGPRLASRIIRFRQGCGGFYSVEQVAGIYGISDSLFSVLRPLLKLEQQSFAKININSWDVDSLAAHPYIQKHEARAIVNFRRQHGRFNGPEDLLEITILSLGWLDRVREYLSFE